MYSIRPRKHSERLKWSSVDIMPMERKRPTSAHDSAGMGRDT